MNLPAPRPDAVQPAQAVPAEVQASWSEGLSLYDYVRHAPRPKK